jgi:hypothetical protein
MIYLWGNLGAQIKFQFRWAISRCIEGDEELGNKHGEGDSMKGQAYSYIDDNL